MKKVLNKAIFLTVCLSILSMSISNVNADDKVRSVKKHTISGSYKRVESKIKYNKAIRLSWDKSDNVTGYEISVYGVASKRWRVVKRTKKTHYSFANMLKKDKLKVRIRTYTDGLDGRKYGAWSKTVKFTTKKLVAKRNSKGRIKKFYDRYVAEQAFVLQNKMRRDAGSKELIWSEAAYKVALKRAKDISKDFSHDKLDATALDVLSKEYGVNGLEYEYEEDGFTCNSYYITGENIATGQGDYKHVMNTWKNSPGHYLNLKDFNYKSGAIACYWNGKQTYFAAVFCDSDLDSNLTEAIK
ncbi:MAG: hypothetical protein K6G88_07720 [Lachnospiraceae bacterium]|nr:hypothetical protein [Lachnospiraceae bacterium]